jgi:hypothetical protein
LNIIIRKLVLGQIIVYLGEKQPEGKRNCEI